MIVPLLDPDCIGECVNQDKLDNDNDDAEDDRCALINADVVNDDKLDPNIGDGKGDGLGEGRAFIKVWAGDRDNECKEEDDPVRGRRDMLFMLLNF
jgi:hypothetical protein